MLGDNVRRFILYVLLFFGCAFAPCLNVASAASNESEASASLDENSYRAYLERIAKVERDIIYTNTPEDLPYLKSFQELAADGAENIDLCIRFLTKSEATGQRWIAISSMSKLDVDHYVVFVRGLAKLHHSGLLYGNELSPGIHGRYSDLVLEQYQNPKIQTLFKELAAQEDIPPDIKETIRYIRSGEGFARNRWRDFDRECTRWSEMQSISACVSLATQILRVYAVSRLTW
jgi:hypothetical protein